MCVPRVQVQLPSDFAVCKTIKDTGVSLRELVEQRGFSNAEPKQLKPFATSEHVGNEGKLSRDREGADGTATRKQEGSSSSVVEQSTQSVAEAADALLVALGGAVTATIGYTAYFFFTQG